MAPIRTQVKKKTGKAHSTSKVTKRPAELKMKVRRVDEVLASSKKSSSSKSVTKSKTKSFGSMLSELKKREQEDEEKVGKNTFISRGLMGEGEITFTVESKKKKKRSEEDEEDEEEDGEEGKKRKERDTGRKSQRWAGRRSASNNVLRKLM